VVFFLKKQFIYLLWFKSSVLQLMRLHEFAAYPHIEAGLWGVAHRDNSRCRTQFANCPSTSEAFINELNSTPGGVQSMLTNALQAVRAIIPGSTGTVYLARKGISRD
jgi:hypothetical protein